MWHEARRSERKVHDLMDAARKRAERRASFLAKQRGDPQQQLKIVGTRCRMYHDQAIFQATQEQHGLIPWNGREDNLIDRFDGRALLDFIRETRSRHERTEEEEELEELVNFERYRDLIKHRRRGFSDEQGLVDADQEPAFGTVAQLDRQRAPKGTYSQVGFSYDGDSKNDGSTDGEDHDGEGTSEDSQDEEIECIGKDHGVQRFNWLSCLDKKTKEAEQRQKEESTKADPAMKRLSRKERRKASQGRDGSRYDPYREARSSPSDHRSKRWRSRSRSLSPARTSWRPEKRGRPEYSTSSPPSPPFQADRMTRQAAGSRILEAFHADAAASAAPFSAEWERNHVKKDPKGPSMSSTKSALAKLSKPASFPKAQQSDAKETPQERLKRILSKQLNKQIRKDTMSESLKKREQEKQRLERLAETRRHARSRSSSRSRSPVRHRSRSPSSRGRSPRNYG